MELNLLMKKQILLTDLHMHNTQVYSFLTLAHALAPLILAHFRSGQVHLTRALSDRASRLKC